MPILRTELSPLLHTLQQRLPVFFNRPDNPQNRPFPWGISAPSNTRFLGARDSALNLHLDRFGRFCMARERAQQTQRPRYSICSNGPHLAIAAMWHNNNSKLVFQAHRQQFVIATQAATQINITQNILPS